MDPNIPLGWSTVGSTLESFSYPLYLDQSIPPWTQKEAIQIEEIGHAIHHYGYGPPN